MIFLKIGDINLSEFLDKQNYEMNSADVYEVWTDGNGIDHRVITRQRISGTVKIGYNCNYDFSAFVGLLNSQRSADGYYTVTAYVNNTNTTQTFYAYIDTITSAKWDFVNGREWHEITMQITER